MAVRLISLTKASGDSASDSDLWRDPINSDSPTWYAICLVLCLMLAFLITRIFMLCCRPNIEGRHEEQSGIAKFYALCWVSNICPGSSYKFQVQRFTMVVLFNSVPEPELNL